MKLFLHLDRYLTQRYWRVREMSAECEVAARFLEPSRIRTHLTALEKLTLYSLARQERPRVVVEIGSYVGASAVFLASGLVDGATVTSRIFCIDTWKNDSMTEGKLDTWTQFQTNTAHFGDIINPLRGWSTEVVEKIAEPVDLLFIDGDHSYEGVKSDVNAWFPKLGPASIVVFHDIGWARGVQRVVKEDVLPTAKRIKRLPNLFWAWIDKDLYLRLHQSPRI